MATVTEARAGVSFQRYSALLTSSGWAPNGQLEDAPLPLSTSVRIGRLLVPKPLRDGVKSALTRALAPRERRHAAALVKSGRDVRLHLGCGPNHLNGWVNIDLVSTGADLKWDLSRPAPFPDGSIAAIFHEHLLEHLPLPAGLGFLGECHRLLRPGGILRLGVPDFGRYVCSYAGDHSHIERLRPGRPTALLALSEVVFCYGHVSAWDGETLLGALHAVGFTKAEVRPYGDSVLAPVPDSHWRASESVYAEAVKD